MEKKKQKIKQVKQQEQLSGKKNTSGEGISTGNIDALVIAEKDQLKVYTEDKADNLYRILIERMNQGALTINKNGIILFCNNYYANMVKLPLQKIIGNLFVNFVGDHLKAYCETLLKNSWNKPETEEIFLLTNDGQSVPVLISLNVLSLGNIEVLSLVVTDLTIQKKNQEAIKLKSFQVEEMNVELTRINVELNERNDDKEKQAIMLLAITEDLKEQQNRLQGVNDKLYEKTDLLQRQEDKITQINNDLKKLNEELEERVLFRTSELEKLNKELKNLNVSKDKFLSVVSHDLRNPLAALIMSSELLNSKTNSLLFDEIQPLIKIVDRTSHNILKQLNELVEWAQIQHTKATIHLEKLILFKEVDKSLELLKEIAAQKNTRLQNMVETEMSVYADTIMLRSIIQNLVTNAIKYTPQNGIISISAKKVGKMVEVSIKDSGLGITKEAKDHLMNNYKIHSSEGTNNEKGTGLGIILVKDFVSLHGGSVQIESEINKGTNFIFSLPG